MGPGPRGRQGEQHLKRVVIFGNSGSGKSTLAKAMARSGELPHLDLDTLAWLPVEPPQRQPIAASAAAIRAFTASHDNWVLEGCYADLLSLAIPAATEIIYLDLPIEQCVANAGNRPWEPHKYATKAAQDANLQMLIEWIRMYEQREDTFSRRAHTALYDNFTGKKTRYTSKEHSRRL